MHPNRAELRVFQPDQNPKPVLYESLSESDI